MRTFVNEQKTEEAWPAHSDDSNKGSAGRRWDYRRSIGLYSSRTGRQREQLLNGTYEPKPVHSGGNPEAGWRGCESLGIPDRAVRFVQQAVSGAMQSYEGEPARSPITAYGFHASIVTSSLAQAPSIITQCYGWVIDLDLDQFIRSSKARHKRGPDRQANVEEQAAVATIRPSLHSGWW